MQRMSARDAKNGFGKLIDLARAEPVTVEEYERPSGTTEKQRSAATLAKGKGVMTMNTAAATRTLKAA